MNASDAEDFSLIETMRFGPFPAGFRALAEKGPSDGPLSGYFLLGLHMNRLLGSAERLGFRADEALIHDSLEETAHSILKEGGGPFRVRLLLSRNGRIQISWGPLQEVSLPVGFDICPELRQEAEEFILNKTTRRAFLDEQLRLAKGRGLFDTILLNSQGQVTEGTITNIFVEVSEGAPLITPPVSAGLLPGVLRQHLLEEGRAAAAPVSREDLLSARRIYLGNSVRGLMEARLAP